MDSNERWQFRVDRSDVRKADLVEVPARTLAAGQVELRLRRFALTANNMTYALLGNANNTTPAAHGYFAHFPTVKDKGLLPVWGIAEVADSRSDDVTTGTQVYGFLPLASHWVVTPGKVSQRSFEDCADYRRELPSVYNHYTIVDQATDFDTRDSHLWIIFRPLLQTGYLIAERLRAQDYGGAQRILFLSASSKTALITAHCLRTGEGSPELVALTSTDNVSFVQQTGLYADTLSYDDIAGLAAGKTTALIDLAGNGELTGRVIAHLGAQLCSNLIVGKSHWSAPPAAGDIPGPAPEFFFAPAAIAQRVEEWGLEEVRKRFAGAWSSFLPEARRFIEVHIGHGKNNVPVIYRLLRDGELNPRNPQVIQLD